MLGIDPNDGMGLVHYGFILKFETHYEESIPYLQRGIATGAEGTVEGRFYSNLGDALRRIGREEEVCLKVNFATCIYRVFLLRHRI